MPDVIEREFLLTLHRRAGKLALDVSHYSELRDRIRQTQYDLDRL